MGHTQGLSTVPTSSGTRDRRTTHTPLTTAPTSSGTGGRRTTHRGVVVSGVWGGGKCPLERQLQRPLGLWERFPKATWWWWVVE